MTSPQAVTSAPAAGGPASTPAAGRLWRLLRLMVLAGLAALLAACASGPGGAGSSPASSGAAAPPTPVSAVPGSPGPGSPVPGTPAPGTPSGSPTTPPGQAPCGIRPMPGAAGLAAAGLTLRNQSNGGTFCVRAGERVTVYLKGTPTRRWAPIRSDSGVLAAVAWGPLTLPVGVTGASFLATRPGTAHLSSDRPVCSSGPVRCDALLAFRVAVIVSESGAAR